MKSVSKIIYSGPFSIQTTLPAGESESFVLSHSVVIEEKEIGAKTKKSIEQEGEPICNESIVLKTI